MDRLTTRVRTWSPMHRGPDHGRLEGRRGYYYPSPASVGYLVNHSAGLAGSQGVGYDYVLGSGGLYVQAESAHLTAENAGRSRCRARAGSCIGKRWSWPTAPFRPTSSSWDWPGCWRAGHRAVLRGALGRRRLPAGGSPAAGHGFLPHLHAFHRRHRRIPLPRQPQGLFSATDDGDEQGFRVYGVVGRLDTPAPEVALRLGIYGHFAPLHWSQVFDGPHPSYCGWRMRSCNRRQQDCI